jgi:hypothetical protein
MAPFLRRPGTIPPVNLTQGGKAGNKDPRLTFSGNNPFAQPDIQQFAREKRALAYQPPTPYANNPPAPADITARTIPSTVQYVPWAVAPPLNFVPVLWVPRNAARIGLILGNENVATLHFSIGPPQLINGATPTGYLLVTGQILQFQTGGVPIDDIYLFANAAGILAIAYEGFQVTGQS